MDSNSDNFFPVSLCDALPAKSKVGRRSSTGESVTTLSTAEMSHSSLSPPRTPGRKSKLTMAVKSKAKPMAAFPEFKVDGDDNEDSFEMSADFGDWWNTPEEAAPVEETKKKTKKKKKVRRISVAEMTDDERRKMMQTAKFRSKQGEGEEEAVQEALRKMGLSGDEEMGRVGRRASCGDVRRSRPRSKSRTERRRSKSRPQKSEDKSDRSRSTVRSPREETTREGGGESRRSRSITRSSDKERSASKHRSSRSKSRSSAVDRTRSKSTAPRETPGRTIKAIPRTRSRSRHRSSKSQPVEGEE